MKNLKNLSKEELINYAEHLQNSNENCYREIIRLKHICNLDDKQKARIYKKEFKKGNFGRIHELDGNSLEKKLQDENFKLREDIKSLKAENKEEKIKIVFGKENLESADNSVFYIDPVYKDLIEYFVFNDINNIFLIFDDILIFMVQSNESDGLLNLIKELSIFNETLRDVMLAKNKEDKETAA